MPTELHDNYTLSYFIDVSVPSSALAREYVNSSCAYKILLWSEEDYKKLTGGTEEENLTSEYQ